MELTTIISGQIQQPYSIGTRSIDTLILRGNSLLCESQISLVFLYKLFYSETDKQNLPIAAISALVDLDNSESKNWIRADPVLLHADLASLLLFDSQKISIIKEDVDSILSIINSFLKEDGLQLIYGASLSRWYLEIEKGNHQNELFTACPKEVNGQDVGQFLPQGKDSAYWIKLSSEIQMLLHDCSINQQRQQRGEAPINSVWFWGRGQPLDKDRLSLQSKFDCIISDDVNAIGLAKAAQIPHQKIPADLEGWLAVQDKNKKILLVLSTGDLAVSESENYTNWLIEQDEKIYKPILESIKKGRVKKLEIKADDQHCIVKRHHLYRFWRKAKNSIEE